MFSYQVDDEVSLSLPRSSIDAYPIYNLVEASRSELSPWLPWTEKTKSVEDERRFLETCLAHFGVGKSLNCVIKYQNNIAGMISLNQFLTINNSTSIGYWLGTKFLHKGIMHRSAKAITNIAFEDYNLNKVMIYAGTKNFSSNQVARNLDFNLDGIVRAGEVLQEATYIDLNEWSLLREEWKINKKYSSNN